MEHSEATTLFTTDNHLCADYHVVPDEIEIEYAMRDGWDDTYDEDERVGKAPFICYNSHTNDFLYGYILYIDDDCIGSIVDEEEFSPEEKQHLEAVISGNFTNL